jgi:hypothetical protein
MSTQKGKYEMEQESQKQTYIALLEASLIKKRDLLLELCQLSKDQQTIILENKVDSEKFDETIEQKEIRIQQINQLDDGFEQLYQRVREELTAAPKNYQNEINNLKELITAVTDIGVELQVIERHNKAKIEFYFQSRKKDMRNLRLNSKTATNYYKTMTELHEQQAYFFDKKK